MVRKRMLWVVVALLCGLVISLRGLPPQVAQAQEPGVNLLRNGDFEEGAGGAWPFQDGIPEVQIAPGWHAFYVDNPPAYAKIPFHCADNPTACSYWRRPEFRGVSAAEFSYRVYQGFLSQKYFTFAGQHEAGLYQQVGGITPGVRLRFSAYMVTWSCAPSAERWNYCPTAPLSNNPSPMHAKVGIDPTGGTNPWSPNVVWSPELNATDNWTYFSVEAVAANVTVTVFTYTWADWADQLFRVNNDVYLDTASLVVVGDPVPTPEPTTAPAQLVVQATAAAYVPAPTATPLPDGSIVHTVRAGDTLYAIAYDYDVPADQIIALNAISDPGWLIVGQELIISRPGGVIAAAATPETAITPPATLPLPESTPQVQAQTDVPAGGKLCVLAFQDVNQDGLKQSEELLLPAVTFTIRGAAGEPARHTTNGIQEPYCLDALTGQYQVIAQAAGGYKATLGNAYLLMVDQSGPTNLSVGFVPDGTASSVSAPEETQTSQESSSVQSKTSSHLPLILGITTVVLLLAAGGVGFFVLRRR